MNHIIGIGNYSMYDDSIGIRVIEHIHQINQGSWEFPRFAAIEIGGNLLNLLSYFHPEVESILFVDSAKMQQAPGSYRIFELNEVENSSKEFSNISTHEGDLLKIIALARKTDYHIPPIKIMGIEPMEMRNEIGLSPLLAAHLLHYARVAVSLVAI
ncbi:MAG: hydrogenase maturation protease [Oligoflexia bacterium]|nr:hydrogenase maturation protease [Oligoflexia bacterium]